MLIKIRNTGLTIGVVEELCTDRCTHKLYQSNW